MNITLQIPSHIAHAIHLPRPVDEQLLMVEFAVALYAQGMLSFGKARALAEMDKQTFGHLLGKREIPRHYTQTDLEDDFAYAYGE